MIFVRTKIFGIRLVYEFGMKWYYMLAFLTIKVFVRKLLNKGHEQSM